MDSSFKGFCFGRRSPEPMRETDEDDGGGGGVLEVHIHHARNIHNICIYDNQDVYAKFSLTCSPDEAISSRVVPGGGRNPDFDERLVIKVPCPGASVLKCEIWMLSRARDYMEDQLLGFALVPLSSLAATGKAKKVTEDFTLSSTDLFHTPAGTVLLTLSLSTSPAADHSNAAFATPSSSIASEVVLLDPREYVRLEFPDIGVARENQQMVSEYFITMAEQSTPSRPTGVMDSSGAGVPFLQLGAASPSMEDYDMAANSSEEHSGESVSPDGGSAHNSGIFGSTTTSLSDDRNSADSREKKNPECANGSGPAATQSSETPPETPTSKAAGAGSDSRESRVPMNAEAEAEATDLNSRGAGSMAGTESVFKSPLGSINMEEEQSAMQQQIVDMYMRSMQQFTESLAKMKLPMDLDEPKKGDGGDVIQSRSSNGEKDGKKKDGSRVFYGSRAFF